MTNCQVGAELFRADGQAWLKLIVAFRNFAHSRKNSTVCLQSAFMRFVPSSEQTAAFVL